MKLFRHYKNKYYKLLGTARHSETMEEFALYETLYESSGGKTWVRPKEMFFGEIEIDGRKTARFAAHTPEVEEFSAIGPREIDRIAPLMKACFGEWDRKWFDSTFEVQTRFHLLFANLDGKTAAFKLGYAKEREIFYSWLGGVLPEYRNHGLASHLMRVQHDWCKRNGYTRVQTKTQNRFRDMLILNLRHGFQIIGTSESKDGPKILLEKKLE